MRISHYFDSKTTLESDGDTYKRYFYTVEATAWEIVELSVYDQDARPVDVSKLPLSDQAELINIVDGIQEKCGRDIAQYFQRRA